MVARRGCRKAVLTWSVLAILSLSVILSNQKSLRAVSQAGQPWQPTAGDPAVHREPLMPTQPPATLPTPATKNKRHHKATIVVQLSGEMANNLQHIAIGKGLQWWLQDEFDIRSNIIVRSFAIRNQAEKPTWKYARTAIQSCFPHLADWDFKAGNAQEYLLRNRQQNAWNEGDVDAMQGLVNSWKADEIHQGLRKFRDLLQHPTRPTVPADAIIGIPFIYSQSLDPYPIIDRYYTRLRDFFQFNDASSYCCEKRPQPNESVLHFRNYQSELGASKAFHMGFPDITPDHTTKHIFPHATQMKTITITMENPSSSRSSNQPAAVAITTRIPNGKARAHVDALTNAGIPSHLIENQSGVQDFCFLKSTKQELIGNARSTYVLWAGLLGDPKSLRLYHINSKGLRARHSDHFMNRFSYNFTIDQSLQRKVRFELYPE